MKTVDLPPYLLKDISDLNRSSKVAVCNLF